MKFIKIYKEFEDESVIYQDWKDFNFKGVKSYFLCPSCKYRFLEQDCVKILRKERYGDFFDNGCPLCFEKVHEQYNPYHPDNKEQLLDLPTILVSIVCLIWIICVIVFFINIPNMVKSFMNAR